MLNNEFGVDISSFLRMYCPYGSFVGLHFTDALTGEDLGLHRDYFHQMVESHGCRVLLARMEAV